MKFTLLGAVLAVSLPSAAVRAEGPVIVELFTSQGCSSCPPADHLISTWGLQEFQKGNVLPLSFNVDYWNYLGWKDVFSAPAWSERQARYASMLGDRTYTPQMVVAGREIFIGSDGRRAREAVEKFSNQPARAHLELKEIPARASDARIKLTIFPLTPSAQGLHVMLAFFETRLRTDVLRGENANRDLQNDFVVRHFVDLGVLEAGKTFHREIDQAWNSQWMRQNSGAAVFLQNPSTMAIYDAKSLFPL